MAHPAICLKEDKPISEAMDMMASYGLQCLVAEDSIGQVTGIISEQSISRAVYHRLTEYPVRDIVQSEITVAREDMSFYEVKKVIVDQHQRILPVVDENGRALGVITKSDLLRFLANEAGESEKASPRTPFDRNLTTIMEDRLPPKIMGLLNGMGHLASELG
jgi:tRNA nucleotidyltransferase (CCA-adding enzyme)